jgi:hypothetical protein
MKKSTWVAALLLTAALAFVAGCANQSGHGNRPLPPGSQPGPTVVNEPPPPPPDEPAVRPPGPEYAYAWMPGYWTWQGRWVWLKGAWAPLPSPKSVWVPGQWAKRGHRYIWIAGRWQ